MYDYIISDKRITGADTLLLTMEPARGSAAVEFYPGQYIALSFKVEGRPTPMRCFSIVSTPRDPYLQVAMRVRGMFTQKASELQVGDTIRLNGPFGQFVPNPDYDRRIVMLAGGIGITPFMSMIRYASQLCDRTPMTLLYRASSMRDVPFMQELLMLERQNPSFKVRFFVRDAQAGQVPGADITNQPLEERAIAEASNNWNADTTFFLCGPTGFLRSYRHMVSSKVSSDRIVDESFTQATKLGWSKWSIPKVTYALTALTMIVGVGFIMVLDLVRILPKTASAQSPTASANSANVPSTQSTASSSSPSSQSTNSSTNTTSSSTANSAPQQSYYYYQPRTSVS